MTLTPRSLRILGPTCPPPETPEMLSRQYVFKVSGIMYKMLSQSQPDPKLGTNKAALRTKTPQLGAEMAPKPANLKPKWLPRSPTWNQDGPQTPNLELKWPPHTQLGIKMAQLTPDLEPRWPPTLQLGAKMASKTSN